MHYLWRAVDHEGEVLESFVTKTRDKAAALKFMKRALKRFGRPEIIVTDGLRSYSAAMGELGNLDRQERSEEHTSELQSLMRISYAVFCLKKQTTTIINIYKRSI